jgi:ElaB/YqjD/DUF883 family membrane-anchored ribosome-binding protein
MNDENNKSHTSSSQFDQVNQTVEGIANKIVNKTPMGNIKNKAENAKETAKEIPGAIKENFKNKIKGDSDTPKTDTPKSDIPKTESFADDVISEQSPNGKSDKLSLKDKLGHDVEQIKDGIGEGTKKIGKKAKDTFDNSIAGKSVQGVKNAKKGLKDTKDRVAHGISNAKKTAQNFKNADGVKGKAKFVANGVGRRAKSKWANSETRNKLKKFIATVKRIIAIIKAVYIPLAITMGLILLIGNFAIWVYSVYAAVGRTPHYYCDIETDDPGIKRSYLYQQYCANGSSLNLEELNGHYIVQGGSGPCTSCATLNLWMRYFTANDVNFFDYLWNENGETLNNVNAHNADMSTTFAAISPGTAEGYSDFVNDVMTAKNFMQEHNKGNYSTMGYVYNEEEYTEKEDLSGSSDWTFTTLLGDYGDTNFGCRGWNNGVTVTIDNVSLTMKSETDSANMNTEYLKKLLETHPSGVVVYFKYYSEGYGHHGMLITKFEDGKFYMVDSAPRLHGGWELPVEDSSRGAGLWYESVDAIIGSNPIEGFHYIENDITN